MNLLKLWRGPPLILASRSEGRANLLRAAGIECTIIPSTFDERAFESAHDLSPDDLAIGLARGKALAVAKDHSGALVLGADQVCSLDGRILHKAVSRDGAEAQLRAVHGRTHCLYSAISLVCDDRVIFEHVERAALTMRMFSDEFLQTYLDVVQDRVMQTVGGYEIEGIGLQLFEQIEGDHATIIGMPLLPLLPVLRAHAGLLS